jgi:hypothetical protein
LGASAATAGVTAVRTLNAEIHANFIVFSPFRDLNAPAT